MARKPTEVGQTGQTFVDNISDNFGELYGHINALNTHLGGLATLMPAGGNWNDVMATGFYRNNTGMTNGPPAVAGAHTRFYAIVLQHGAAYAAQLAVDFNGAAVWVRARTSAATPWQQWRQISLALDNAAPTTLAQTSTAGTSTSAARRDHVHGLPMRNSSWINSTGQLGANIFRPQQTGEQASSALAWQDGAGNRIAIGAALNNSGEVGLFSRHTAAQIAAGANANPTHLLRVTAAGVLHGLTPAVNAQGTEIPTAEWVRARIAAATGLPVTGFSVPVEAESSETAEMPFIDELAATVEELKCELAELKQELAELKGEAKT